MYSTLFGLIGSVPAAIINTLVLAYLARRRRDASGLAIGSGLSLGLLVGVTLRTIVVLLDEGLATTPGRACSSLPRASACPFWSPADSWARCIGSSRSGRVAGGGCSRSASGPRSWRWSSVLRHRKFSALICLIGSIPAAASMPSCSGTAHGKGSTSSGGRWAVAASSACSSPSSSLIWVSDYFNRLTASWFGATGALMGALHWYFAIRPRRQRRLSLLQDAEMIRAME